MEVSRCPPRQQVGSPESLLAPLGGKDTPKQRRRLKLLEVEDGDGERCSDMMVTWSAVKWKVCWRARSPSGTSPAAGSDPTRPPSPEGCGCASAFQHQHVCLHQLSIPPLTYCRKASLLTHHVSTFLFFDHLVVLSHLWNVQLAPAREHKYSLSFNSY